mgnify:CR=1 FL=1
MQDSQLPQPLLLRQVCEGTVWMHTNRVSQAEMTEPSGKRNSKRREKEENKREKKGTKKRKKQKNLLTRYVGLSTSFLYKIRALKIS